MRQASGGIWAGLAMAAFGVAIVSGVVAHLLVVMVFGLRDDVDDEVAVLITAVVTIAMTLLFFVLAVASLTVFGFENVT